MIWVSVCGCGKKWQRFRKQRLRTQTICLGFFSYKIFKLSGAKTVVVLRLEMISSRLWLKVLLWIWEPLLVNIFVRWFLLEDAKFRRVNCWACRKNGRFLKICGVRGGRNTLNVRKKKTDQVKELYDVAFQLGCDYKVRLWSNEQRKNEDDLVGLLFWKVVTPT